MCLCKINEPWGRAIFHPIAIICTILVKAYLMKLHTKKPASVAQLDAPLTGDQEVVGSTPAEIGNILSWRLIMKYFLWSFSPFADSRKAAVSFWWKKVHNTG